MTKIDPLKPTVRESSALYKGKPIVVELHSSYIAFRVKGRSSIHASLTIDGALERALYHQAEQDRAERGAGKKKPRKKLSLLK